MFLNILEDLMKNISLTLAAIFFFCPLAYSQQQILSCVVKAVDGNAKTRQVGQINVGTVIDVPVNSLRENGSTYEHNDLFGTRAYGEKSTFTINRETGEFEFSAWSGGPVSLERTSKNAKGVCAYKKLKL